MIEGVRFEGLSLTVGDVERSVEFYHDKLGLEVVYASPPAFALLRGGAITLGLLSRDEAAKEGVVALSPEQRYGVHVEFTTDDLDGLFQTLMSTGVVFHQPPHEEPWELAMTAFDPDGYSVEFAQGRRGSRLGASDRMPTALCRVLELTEGHTSIISCAPGAEGSLKSTTNNTVIDPEELRRRDGKEVKCPDRASPPARADTSRRPRMLRVSGSSATCGGSWRRAIRPATRFA